MIGEECWAYLRIDGVLTWWPARRIRCRRPGRSKVLIRHGGRTFTSILDSHLTTEYKPQGARP